MSDDPVIDHIFEEPIPRPVIDEIVQLLGYDLADVVRVDISWNQVTVITTHVRRPADQVDVIHRHTIV